MFNTSDATKSLKRAPQGGMHRVGVIGRESGENNLGSSAAFDRDLGIKSSGNLNQSQEFNPA